ncbi:TAXI family TRAP transporter solute-binding subunit [Azospirillum halopraeferens]|uniref:TAXI family TRAP transporter solute-binding subunit n=1 Tax=Azospirillum halopraeferens TaxID=34010 RepID=UPI00040133B2|nr:TAXI family TRAP transporter solute-binding subunit [Azospirillum halopraeferens]
MPHTLRRSIAVFLLCAAALLRPGPVAATELTMATVSLTSEDFQLAMAWSEVLGRQKTGLRITPIATGTAKGLRLLSLGRADLSLIGAPHYLDALGSTGSFKEDPPELVEGYRRLRVLFAIDTGMGQYVVRDDSPVRTLADLKGRRVSIGRPGGNAGRVSTHLFKVHGIDPDRGDVKTEYLDYGASLDRLGNGQIDATLVWGSVPQAGIDQASRGTRLRFVSPDPGSLPALQAAIENGAHYVYRTIPAARIAEAYGGRVASDGDVRFWTFPFMVVVRADMAEDTAYTLCRTFWDQVEAVRAGSAALAMVDPANAASGLSAELHPGARRCLADIGAL